MWRLAAVCAAALSLSGQTAAELQAHVEFLASDLLEGRGNATRGLDIAAEYIAAQFHISGLERGASGSYFQNAEMMMLSSGKDGWSMRLEHNGVTLQVPWEHIYAQPQAALTLESAPVYKLPRGDRVPAEGIKDHVVMTDSAPVSKLTASLVASGALGVVYMTERKPPAFGMIGTRMIRREAEPRLAISMFGEAVEKFYAALPDGATTARVSVRTKPDVKPITMRNVAGILRGSDPQLRDTYVIVSAHYDHEGIRGTGEDRIYNGANDNASGVAAVIAIARELASRKTPPKRSVLFLAFFGEELGLVGSRYYGDHPLVPLKDTVAQINFEQLGRTDDTEGARIAAVSITGFDYSEVPAILADAGKAGGVAITKHPQFSNAFFDRSDNESLALRGVPAHTAVVAFDFPDYHKPSDEAGKLDYQNLEKVARAMAEGVEALANRERAPEWNVQEPGTEQFRKAREAHR